MCNGAEALTVMNDEIRDGHRTLRDYPISLRQSARAVFGNAIPRDEKRNGENAQELAARR